MNYELNVPKFSMHIEKGPTNNIFFFTFQINEHHYLA